MDTTVAKRVYSTINTRLCVVLVITAVMVCSSICHAQAPVPPSGNTPPVVATTPAATTPTYADWQPMYAQGRAMMVSGIVLTGVGGLTAAGAGFFILLTAVMGNTSSVLPGAGYAALVGAGLMVIGIPLLIVGIMKKKRASRIKATMALSWTTHPDLVSGAEIPALSLRF